MSLEGRLGCQAGGAAVPLDCVSLVAERLVRKFAQGMPFDPPYRTRLFEGADRLGQDCRPWQRWL